MSGDDYTATRNDYLEGYADGVKESDDRYWCGWVNGFLSASAILLGEFAFLMWLS